MSEESLSLNLVRRPWGNGDRLVYREPQEDISFAIAADASSVSLSQDGHGFHINATGPVEEIVIVGPSPSGRNGSRRVDLVGEVHAVSVLGAVLFDAKLTGGTVTDRASANSGSQINLGNDPLKTAGHVHTPRKP